MYIYKKMSTKVALVAAKKEVVQRERGVDGAGGRRMAGEGPLWAFCATDAT